MKITKTISSKHGKVLIAWTIKNVISTSLLYIMTRFSKDCFNRRSLSKRQNRLFLMCLTMRSKSKKILRKKFRIPSCLNYFAQDAFHCLIFFSAITVRRVRYKTPPNCTKFDKFLLQCKRSPCIIKYLHV